MAKMEPKPKSLSYKLTSDFTVDKDVYGQMCMCKRTVFAKRQIHAKKEEYSRLSWDVSYMPIMHSARAAQTREISPLLPETCRAQEAQTGGLPRRSSLKTASGFRAQKRRIRSSA